MLISYTLRTEVVTYNNVLQVAPVRLLSAFGRASTSAVALEHQRYVPAGDPMV